MRKLARYALEATAPEASVNGFLQEARQTVEAWLEAKGDWEPAVAGSPPSSLRLKDGQIAVVSRSEVRSEQGEALFWTLEQPVGFGDFRTVLGIAARGDHCALFCELEAGVPSGVVRPAPFEAHCPKVLPQLLALLPEWHVNGDRVVLNCQTFEQEDDIDHVRQLIQSPDRRLPIVVISQSPDFYLPEHVAPDLARNLCGLARVIEIDESVSWGLTFHLGKQMSCYNGGVRIFWPFCGRYQNPYHHPLWIHSRILQLDENLGTAVKARIFYASTLALQRPECFEQIVAGAAAERLEEARQKHDPSEWVQALEEENTRLSVENRDLREECRWLQTEAENWKAISNCSSIPEEEGRHPKPAKSEAPPRSIQDAVDRAIERFADLLVFGRDVGKGVAELNPTAGPPDKIFRYLKALSDLAQAKRKGRLGTTDVNWLNSRAVACSQESDTVMNDPSKVQRRTWHNGEGKQVFSMHLKPTEATHPDKCVRIYFAWDDKRKMIVIGSVGRHPD